jgi:hypothetical protein
VTMFLHEVHRVIGKREDEFEAAYRDPGGWMDILGRETDGRLLYYANQAHGTGPAYRTVTVTAVADGAAYERLARRVQDGNLASWVRRVDDLRHEVRSKILLPVSWSPMGEVDLTSVPTTPQDHAPTLVMEDTGWPYATLDEYTEFWEKDYWPMLSGQPEATRLLEIKAVWVTALGSGRRPEAILWQRIHSMERLMELLAYEIPPARKAAGTYMARALEVRDQWESRMLRCASWSPLS